MAWLSVHQSIAGHKLRGLCKGICCSECEAMGILLKLWLWALDNADKSGELLNADKGDVARIYTGSTATDLSPDKIVDFLISEAWMDYTDGRLFIHDWPEWQKYWFDFQERKEKDRVRKKRGNPSEAAQEIPQKFRGNSSEIPVQTATASKQQLNLIETEHDKNVSCPASRTNGTPTTVLLVQETSQSNRNEIIREVVSFLNLTCNTSYRSSSDKTREKIIARLNEGFTLDDFKAVILKKHADWHKDSERCKYLRPETLFGNKFEGYLNQPDATLKNSFLDIARREAES